MNELLQKWVNAVKSGDPKQVTDLYHENAILLGTFSEKERIGYTLILEYFENLLKLPENVEGVEVGIVSPVEVEIVSEHFSTSDLFAVNSGHYNFVVTGIEEGSPTPIIFKARFSFVYRKDNGEWKIISHHSSLIPKT